MFELFSVQFECSGDFTPAKPERYNHFISHAGYGGEPARLENFTVTFNGLDVTKHLTKEQYAQLEGDYLLEKEEEHSNYEGVG